MKMLLASLSILLVPYFSNSGASSWVSSFTSILTLRVGRSFIKCFIWMTFDTALSNSVQ
jgi:hypothetical protein